MYKTKETPKDTNKIYQNEKEKHNMIKTIMLVIPQYLGSGEPEKIKLVSCGGLLLHAWEYDLLTSHSVINKRGINPEKLLFYVNFPGAKFQYFNKIRQINHAKKQNTPPVQGVNY